MSAEPASTSAAVADLDEERLEQILGRVVRVVAEIRRRQAAVTQRHGVTMLQYTAIQMLRRHGALNITELARRLHLYQSTVSALVDRMERDGLLRRVQSSRDRRAVRLRLTERADAIAETLCISPYELFKGLVRALDSRERTELAHLVERLETLLIGELGRLDAERRPRMTAPARSAGKRNGGKP